MPRFTSAYSDFQTGLNEVQALRRMAARTARAAPLDSRRETNALCRGGIVLLSASLEAYIKGLGELVLEAVHAQGIARTNISGALFYHASKDILDQMVDARDPVRIADRVFEFLARDGGLWSRIGPFPQSVSAERFNKSFANPGFEKVRSYFGRFGYERYKSDLSSRLKGDFNTITNMVDHLVDTRNKIAHGDASATKTPQDLADMIAIIGRFGRETDEVFAAWCKSSLCNIRRKA